MVTKLQRTANDNGGENVTSFGIRHLTGNPTFAEYVAKRRQSPATNDMFDSAARVDMYDDMLPDRFRYVEVAGKREEVDSLRLILNRQSFPATRTVYLLNDKGANIHQFELMDEVLKAGVTGYNRANDVYTRRSVALGTAELFMDAAAKAGITIPQAYAESMFRCCAEQLMPPQPRKAASR